MKPMAAKAARHTAFIFTLFLTAHFFQGNDAMANQTENHLPHCPDTPNCINTEYSDDSSHYLPAVGFTEEEKNQILPLAKVVILNMGGVITQEQKHYLAATFTSSLFKFVDDFELRQDTTSYKLHIRSASRTGYSDFGVNKRRVRQFSEQFKVILKK